MQENKSKVAFWILLDVFIGIMILAALFVLPVVGKFSNSIVPTRTITVSADGKSVVVPDIAKTSFSVVSRGQDSQALAVTNNKKMTDAVNFLKSSGIEAKDIQTTGYNLNPVYEYNRQTQTSFIAAYELRQQVTVKIRDMGKISEIMGKLPTLGVNDVSSISFEVDDEDKVKESARAQAFEKAKAKAEAMAKASGIKLGEVVSVGENQSGPIYYSRAYKTDSALGMGGAESAPAPIEAGSEEITVTVSITYALQ